MISKQLFPALWTGFVLALVMQPAHAEIAVKDRQQKPSRLSVNRVSTIQDLPAVSTDAVLLMAQKTETPVQVTGVKINPTDRGIEVILETQTSPIGQPVAKTEGNSLITDIPNTVLRLPDGKEFRAENPVAGVTSVTVMQTDATEIQVRIIGSESLPTAVVRFSTPVAAQPPTAVDSEEEVVVTGQQENGYRVPNTSIGTKTDTPLRDIPQSIQVIPKEVLQDQGITRIEEALRNVSGVTPGSDFSYGGEFYTIRGFQNQRNLRDGFKTGTGSGGTGTFVAPSNIERVEVLKGPASVLYGQFEPGGIVNYVTKQPLDKPYYAAEFTAGSYGFYQPSIDLSGPLTADKRLLYRLNASYQNSDSFVDFQNGESFSIAPVISYKISDDTKLTFAYEYSRYDRTYYEGLPADPIIFQIPISRNFGEPGDRSRSTTHALNLTLEHRFNDNLSLRSALGGYFVDGSVQTFRPLNFLFDSKTDNTILRFYRQGPDYRADFNWQTDLTAKFKTGSVQHQALLGLEIFNGRSGYSGPDDVEVDPIDILNPIYSAPIPPTPNTGFGEDRALNTIGVYLQDQVTLLPNLKLLIGGRYDFSRGKSQFFSILNGEATRFPATTFYDEAFSPRVGIVYQPIKPISLYASYSRSFVPNNFNDEDGNPLKSTRGTQYEVGIKAEFGKIAATLSAYEITKTNIVRFDPIDSSIARAIGEVRSRGLEFDIGGEILPGWNVIASAFINDSIVTVGDDFSPKGDTLAAAPGNGASIWTTYKIQKGDLKGLGFGFGVFYVGDVEAELPNNFVTPSYVRVDASLFYRRDNWSVGLNFKNLSNTRYYESSGSTTSTVYPGAPFTVLGTVSVKF